jgi:hypothetical protein
MTQDRFRASKFILDGPFDLAQDMLCAFARIFRPFFGRADFLCGDYGFTVNPEEPSLTTAYPTARTSCRSTSVAAAFLKSSSLKE